MKDYLSTSKTSFGPRELVVINAGLAVNSRSTYEQIINDMFHSLESVHPEKQPSILYREHASQHFWTTTGSFDKMEFSGNPKVMPCKASVSNDNKHWDGRAGQHAKTWL